jgi:two-component system sensor histidine kinase YesM
MKMYNNLQKLWIEKVDLRKQIILVMILLVSFTITILGLAIFRVSKKTIERNYQNSHEHNLQVSSKMMDIFLKEIIVNGRVLLENEKFINTMLNEINETPYFSSVNQLAIDNILGERILNNT